MMNTPEGVAVLTGIFSIRGFSVRVLFDSGATHSFINEKILNKLGFKSCHMNRPFLDNYARWVSYHWQFSHESAT
jgi:hypothetical protein